LIDAFVNTQAFRLVQEINSLDELTALVRRGKVYAGLQIPPEFTRRLGAGRNAQVQVLIDGSKSTTAFQALNTAMGMAFRRLLAVLLGETGRRSYRSKSAPKCSTTRPCAPRTSSCRA